MTRRRIVIVGASAAGLAAAETLRTGGYTGELLIVGEEPEQPYDRPPLSKQILAGAWPIERALLRSEADLGKIGAEWRLGCRAVGLKASDHVLKLQNGDHIEFDGLIIATGVRARPLEGRAAFRNVHYLRTLNDALAMRSTLALEPRIVVVGAGVLGTEIAATARALGLDVTVVGPHRLPLHQFGHHIGERLADLHRSNGVDLRLGVSVTSIHGEDGGVSGIGLSNGETCSASAVCVAIGSIPVTDWLDGSGLKIGNGVECDAFCQAAPDIYAAGDVASWWHQGYGRQIRIEHRMNATEQGIAAARNLMGAAEPYCPVPFVWSDQYNVKLQAYGIFPSDGTFSVAADGAKVVAECRQNGRLVGAVGWNAVKDLRLRRQAIADEMLLVA
ncbi:FAD-dependent oxidoreductase [Bradyrhizobium sp. dw_78]|uniref:NAD(P)/FAD-dependent oxidoreductase n=1 Tax=Bradyrhizobium sp. dw_78 TaxID=2719793 RepID=UPI001BD34191|nr:FAD-dependent oxidoreductase [Bradyrhizobium sp. dw_78]